MRLADVQRRHVQGLADRLVADGLSPSTVRNALMPLRVIFRRALRDESSPSTRATGSSCPRTAAARAGSSRAEDAAQLIAALPHRATGRCGRRRSTPGCAAAS